LSKTAETEVAANAQKVLDRADWPVCIWHGGCLDGYTSAWVVNQYFEGEVEFVAGVYQEPPPDVTGRNVIMVDFSYKHDVIEEMRKTARAILILDHHKTAEADLRSYQVASAAAPQFPYLPGSGECVAFFDMDRSGAGLTWDFFFPGTPRPRLVDHVEDRDLWRFKMPGTRSINLAAYSFDFNMPQFDRLVLQCEDDIGWHDMLAQGDALERAHKKNCEALIEHGVQKIRIKGVEFPIVNAPWFFSSDIGNMLSQSHDCKCGATYFEDAHGQKTFSLRSIEGGPDVSEIAKAMGGGGHAHAAGFKVPRDWKGDDDGA